MAHPNKHIREAVQYAIENGWRIEIAGPRAHVYGVIYCVYGHRQCRYGIHSTPRSAENHAQRIVRKVQSCPSFEV